MSDVQPEEIHPPAEQVAEDQAIAREDGPRCPVCGHYADHTQSELPPFAACRGCDWCAIDAEQLRLKGESILREMTRDAEPYADKVDEFGPPRTEPPSPAEAHEIMQRVTGQQRDLMAAAGLPMPPAPADRLIQVDSPLPPVGMQSEVLTELTRRAAQLAAEARSGIKFHPHLACGCTDTVECRLHRTPKAGEMWSAADLQRTGSIAPRLVGDDADVLSKLMGDASVRRAKAEESALRSMGAKGDGHDFVFELDEGDLFTYGRRLRILVRGGAPVSADLSLKPSDLDAGGTLTGEIGKAMLGCMTRIRQILAAWQSSFDPITGEKIEKPEPHGGTE